MRKSIRMISARQQLEWECNECWVHTAGIQSSALGEGDWSVTCEWQTARSQACGDGDRGATWAQRGRKKQQKREQFIERRFLRWGYSCPTQVVWRCLGHRGWRAGGSSRGPPWGLLLASVDSVLKTKVYVASVLFSLLYS